MWSVRPLGGELNPSAGGGVPKQRRHAQRVGGGWTAVSEAGLKLASSITLQASTGMSDGAE